MKSSPLVGLLPLLDITAASGLVMCSDVELRGRLFYTMSTTLRGARLDHLGKVGWQASGAPEDFCSRSYSSQASFGCGFGAIPV